MASINDKFIKTSVVEPTRLRDPLSSSATTLTVESTAGWNGDTAILAVIDRVDSAGNLTPDKMEIVIGTMNAGGLEQLRRGVGGRAQVHSSGAIVELSIAGSEQWNRAMDALISAFGQDGKIKESAFASGLQVVDGSVIKDGSIKPEKLKNIASATDLLASIDLGGLQIQAGWSQFLGNSTKRVDIPISYGKTFSKVIAVMPAFNGWKSTNESSPASKLTDFNSISGDSVSISVNKITNTDATISLSSSNIFGGAYHAVSWIVVGVK